MSARTEELAKLVRLAAPMILAQLGFVSMGLVDTMVVGRVSGEALAGVALGNGLNYTTQSFGLGALVIVGTLAAQAVGAGDEAALRASLQRGFVMAMLIAAPVMVVLQLGGPILRAAHQPEEIVPVAAGYARVVALGIPASFTWNVARQVVQGMHRTRSVLIAVITANVANLVLDIALVHGRFGAPRLGPVGAAWATVGCQWAMLATLLVLERRALAPHWRPEAAVALDRGALGRMFRLGAPIGLQFLIEMGSFSAMAFFMGLIGSLEIAGHQVALQLASFTFMLPLGLSQAASVRVGNAVGRGDPGGARLAAGLSLILGVGVMSASAATFMLVPGPLASLFTHDEHVRALAASLLVIAGVFQIFDGIQVVALGILRGIGDTRTPVVVNMVGFLFAAIPISLLLAFGLKAGAQGLWWGLVAGLALVALVLLLRVRHRLAGDLARLHV